MIKFLKRLFKSKEVFSEPLTYLSTSCVSCKIKFNPPCEVYYGERVFCKECAKNLNLYAKEI